MLHKENKVGLNQTPFNGCERVALVIRSKRDLISPFFGEQKFEL
jgi:hypothetical protein